jgi:hypothetical protein
MDMTTITDVVRFCHILSVAIGLGAAFFADIYALSRITRKVDEALLATLHTCHRIVWIALFGMWITGTAMIYVRTGFELANFSPKLFSKLFTVTLLTINALLIGQIVMPAVAASRGKSLLSLSLSRKVGMGIMGAVSSASWILALAMGVSHILAKSQWIVFIELLPAGYLFSSLGAVGLMVVLHFRHGQKSETLPQTA